MKALVIGGDGLLGRNLVEALYEAGHEVVRTSRDVLSDALYLDLSRPIPTLPPCDVIYLCAAMSGFAKCEGNPLSYVVNVDAPLEIARRKTAFPVYVSSDAIEFVSSTAYARQKMQAELGILMLDGAVIRPGKFNQDNVAPLCRLMINVGVNRKSGVHRWP